MSTDSVELTIEIAAGVEVVFRYFTDPDRFKQWMGANSTLEATPGGTVEIKFPTGDPSALGTVLEIVSERRIVFSWGYQGSNHGMAPGSSTVSVDLFEIPEGTRLVLKHWGFPAAQLGQEHLGGWRHYFGVLGARAAAEVVGAVAEVTVDRFVAAWNESDSEQRAAVLRECFDEEGLYRDAYGYVPGLLGLNTFIGNARKFMPPFTVERTGPVLQTHGQICYPWQLTGSDGSKLAQGVSAGSCSPTGKLRILTGFWS